MGRPRSDRVDFEHRVILPLSQDPGGFWGRYCCHPSRKRSYSVVRLKLLGTFIEGLKPEIRCEVKVRQPYTLRAAISFIRIHEK
ncbi:hypothetical protein BHM03_00001695 [Ensete ventricosum]|nr:hypothetical protein BHM03_00001695 [Ensete ventricosum]